MGTFVLRKVDVSFDVDHHGKELYCQDPLQQDRTKPPCRGPFWICLFDEDVFSSPLGCHNCPPLRLLQTPNRSVVVHEEVDFVSAETMRQQLEICCTDAVLNGQPRSNGDNHPARRAHVRKNETPPKHVFWYDYVFENDFYVDSTISLQITMQNGLQELERPQIEKYRAGVHVQVAET